MSWDTITLLEVTKAGVGLSEISASLSMHPRFGAGLSDVWKNRWGPKEWVIENCKLTGTCLWAPVGFALRLEERILEMYHMMPFSALSSDSLKERDALRRSAMLLADFVGSARALYMPELTNHEGRTLSDTIDWMTANVGPPAQTFFELNQAEYFGPRAWFIDTFMDLR